MDHNGSQDRKASYIGPLVIGCVVAVIAAVLVLRHPSPPPPPAAAAREAIAVAPKFSVPKTPAVLNRADLIAQADRAAAQFADTGKLSVGADPMVGRRFHILLPFGCNGANGVMLNPQATVSYDATQENLTLTAQPGVWTSLPIMQPLADAGKIEAAEGFWLPRPWTKSEECPPASTDLPPAISTPGTAQTLGLAQLFAPGGTRTVQHSQRPYTLVRKVAPEDATQLASTYQLLLEGVITGFPDGRALHCWAEDAAHQPICVYAVTFDQVAFRELATGKILSSWNN